MSASATGAPANATEMLRGYTHCSRTSSDATVLVREMQAISGIFRDRFNCVCFQLINVVSGTAFSVLRTT